METVLRVAYVYVGLMLALRVMGKRELSQLSPFELVTLLLIPEIFQQALVRSDFSMTNASIAAATLLSLVYLTSMATHRSQRVAGLLEGEPTVLVANGRLVERNLNCERVSPAEVFSEMHKSGLERLDQVRWAILERDGKISVVPAETGAGTGRPHDDHVPS